MTIFTFANNVNTTLAGAVSSGATTITLSSTQNLPSSIPSGQVLVITLNDAATRGNYEIVYVTAISGATLTVTRAQEGTSALSWLTGDFAYSPPTAGQMGNMGQLGGSNTWTGNNSFNDPVTVANATASGHALNKGQAEAEFAQLNGSPSQTFSVANATSSTQAIPLGQLPTQFPSSLTSSGYKKIPDSNSPTGYYIEQWGNVTLGNGSGQFVTLPIAFPNAFLHSTCSYGSVPTAGQTCGSAPGNLSTILIGNATTTTNQIFYTARGY
ncbi:TPA: hypothetical protein ACKE3D_002104 [Burkholderia dolosa]